MDDLLPHGHVLIAAENYTPVTESSRNRSSMQTREVRNIGTVDRPSLDCGKLQLLVIRGVDQAGLTCRQDIDSATAQTGHQRASTRIMVQVQLDHAGRCFALVAR